MTNVESWDDKRSLFETVKTQMAEGVEEFEGFVDLETGRRGREGLPYEELIGNGSIPSYASFQANIGRFVKFYPVVMQDIEEIVTHENGPNTIEVRSVVDMDETVKIMSSITNRLNKHFSTDELPVSFSGKISGEHIYIKFNGRKVSKPRKAKVETSSTMSTEQRATVISNDVESVEIANEIMDIPDIPAQSMPLPASNA